MAPSYKLIYFNGRGRAEIARLVFAAAGVEFADARITGDEWQAEKPNTPMGQLPVLEVDGKRFGQSIAIANYLAREFGMYGSNSMEAMQVDQVVMTVQDFVSQLTKAFFEKDEAKKAELMKNVQEVETPKFLAIFEKLAKANGTGFMVGKKMSLADIAMFDIFFNVQKNQGPVLDKFPAVKAAYDKVANDDKVKAYVAKRPDTTF